MGSLEEKIKRLNEQKEAAVARVQELKDEITRLTQQKEQVRRARSCLGAFLAIHLSGRGWTASTSSWRPSWTTCRRKSSSTRRYTPSLFPSCAELSKQRFVIQY
jgi:hypothetical protein